MRFGNPGPPGNAVGPGRREANQAALQAGRSSGKAGFAARRAAQVKIKGRNTPQTYKQTERCA